MIKFQNIKVIVFDLGGVLIDMDKERCVSNFEKIGIFDTDKIIGITASSDVIFELETGQISREDFYRIMRQRSSLNPANEQIDAAWVSLFRGIPSYKIEMLEQLQAQNYRLFLLSNTNPVHIEGLNKMLAAEGRKPIQHYFERCFFSYEMKLAKPDMAVYQYLVSEIAEKPENILFIDDGAQNTAAAATIGIQTYLAQEREKFNFLFE